MIDMVLRQEDFKASERLGCGMGSPEEGRGVPCLRANKKAGLIPPSRRRIGMISHRDPVILEQVLSWEPAPGWLIREFRGPVPAAIRRFDLLVLNSGALTRGRQYIRDLPRASNQ